MNGRLRALIGIVVAGGAAALAFGLARPTSENLGLLATIIILGALAERYAVGLPEGDISVGMVAVLAAAMLAGSWGVVLVAPLIVLAGHLRKPDLWYKRVYNVAAYLLAGMAFAAVLYAFGDVGRPGTWPGVLIPSLLGAAAVFVANTGLVAAAVAFDQEEPFATAWRRYYWLLPQYLLMGAAAAGAAAAYQALGIWGLLVFAAPVAGIRHAYFHGAKNTERRDSDLRPAA